MDLLIVFLLALAGGLLIGAALGWREACRVRGVLVLPWREPVDADDPAQSAGA